VIDFLGDFAYDDSRSRYSKYRDRILDFYKKYDTVVEGIKESIQYVTDTYLEDKPVVELLEKGGNLHAPYPFSKKYKINMIDAAFETFRNVAMVNSILKALDEHSSVLAINGSGHVEELIMPLYGVLKQKYGQEPELFTFKEHQHTAAST